MATRIVPELKTADVPGLLGVLRASFDSWGKHHSKFSGMYKSLDKNILIIGHTGLQEMEVPKPGSWEVWWALNHNRFIREKGVRQRDLITLHELMYNYLTDLSRGKLEELSDGRRKAKNKIESSSS